MKNSTRKSYFNIVEVALAMAIIGLGMTSIMALFPIGINASRSAIGNTAATEVAENFMGYIKSYAESSTTNYTSVSSLGISSVNTLRTTLKTKTLVADDVTCDFLKDLKAGNIDGSSDYVSVTAWNSLFRSSTRSYLYTTIQRSTDTSTEPDFSAAILVWTTDLNHPNSGGGTGAEEINWVADKTDIMVLNLEVSWPLSKIYKDREVRYFQTIIVN